MRNVIASKVYEKAEKDDNFFLISGDAGLGVWDEYKVKFADKFLNPGVNEACDVGMASGLALRGHKVVYYNIAPFVIMRPYEQVRNDICYQEVPVILVGTGSGVTYAPAGMTHYVVEDLTLCRTLPNLDVFSPCDPAEARLAFDYAYESDRPSYIRVPKAGEPVLHKSEVFDITKSHVMRDGSDALIISHSAMVEEAMKAALMLAEKGVSAQVVSKPMVSSIDDELIQMVQSFEHVFVLEEHYADGGLGTALVSKINADNIYRSVNIIAIKNEYIHTVGDRDFLRRHYGIDAESVCAKVYSKVK